MGIIDFHLELREMDKSALLDIPSYKSPYLSKEDAVLGEMEHMIKSDLRVLVYGDYDPDGASCFLILQKTFEKLGFTNFEIFRYNHRTHDIDPTAISKAINEKFKYMIICDAGSKSPGDIKRLNMMGVTTILLDHHQSPYDYEDFAGFMINTTFENRTNKQELILSAGALTYVVCEKLLRRFNVTEDPSLSAIALISMYADSVDMSSELARSIYHKCINLSDTKLPKFAQHFLTEHTRFSRRFIEFTLVPKINSLFRSEQFDLLNRYLLWSPGSDNIYKLVETITESHAFIKGETDKASDTLEPEVLSNFVIGDLSSVARYVKIPEDKLFNYTGLVANSLASKYKKTAIVFADSGHAIKGSLRDLNGRNYLELFSQFCNCGGHNSAFGIHIDYMDKTRFLEYIRLIDKQFFITSVSNKPLIIPHNVEIPNVNLIDDMAKYNEFAGVTCPVALLSKVWPGSRTVPNATQYGTRYYRWGPEISIKSKRIIMPNSLIHIKPYQGKGRRLEVVDANI